MSLLNRISKDLTIKISTTPVSGLYFADLTTCMAWLHKRSIAASATVTINFDASYTGTESGTAFTSAYCAGVTTLGTINATTGAFIG